MSCAAQATSCYIRQTGMLRKCQWHDCLTWENGTDMTAWHKKMSPTWLPDMRKCHWHDCLTWENVTDMTVWHEKMSPTPLSDLRKCLRESVSGTAVWQAEKIFVISPAQFYVTPFALLCWYNDLSVTSIIYYQQELSLLQSAANIVCRLQYVAINNQSSTQPVTH